jgi:hypothetical protein
MRRIQKFRDLPGWPEIRKALKEAGMDPNAIAEIERRKELRSTSWR